MDDILLTKLMPPVFRAQLLSRDRLLRTVQKKMEMLHILTITAPAGYGKTVLARQLSQQIDKPLVWLQLDQRDNDVVLFQNLLIKGFQQHWPGLGSIALQLATKVKQSGNNPRLIAAILINELIKAEAEPLLIFDDAHELVETPVIQLLQELISNLPSGMICIIAGRTTFPLNLSQLYITGEAWHIGVSDLKFSNDEISVLINKLYGQQDSQTIDIIDNYTEGWPVILKLAEDVIAGKADRLNYYEQSNRSLVYEYMASQIYKQLPTIYRDFISESAVLTMLTPEHCNRLLERNDSASILNVLDKEYNLLVPLAGMNNAYRLHQLFREFLIENLGSKHSRLLRRAGRFAAIEGDFETALDYYLQTKFDAEAEAVLAEAGKRALAEGRWHSIALWLGRLDDNQIAKYPWLSYFRAVVEVYKGHLYEAEKWVGQAVSNFEKRSDPSAMMECRLLQARILRGFGCYRDSLEILEQIASENETEAMQRYDLILEKGYNLFLLGEMPSAEKYLTKQLTIFRKSGNQQAVLFLTEALGNICYQQGKHAKALQLYQWCLRTSGNNLMSGYYAQDTMPYIYCDWGELDKALDLAEKHLDVKLRHQMIEALPSTYSSLAYIYFELGNYEKVEELTTKALELLHQHGEERFYLILNQMVFAWARLAQGHWIEARELVEKCLAEAEHQADQVCSMVQMLAGTALAMMGSLDEAEDVLLRSEVSLKKMNFKIRLCDTYKALAFIYAVKGDRKSFKKYASMFLHLGSRMNYVSNKLHFTVDLLKPIIRFSLENGIEEFFSQRMISRLGHKSKMLLLELIEHPDPVVRQRIIAPLTELADEQILQALKLMTQDKDSSVSQSAQAYISLHNNIVKKINRVQIDNQPSAPRLEVNTLGLLKFSFNGKDIFDWRTKKTRELFCLLIHLGKPTCKERIREELWPDLESQKSNALFGTTIHYLRKRLEQEGLVKMVHFNHGLYSLDSTMIHTDVADFEDLLKTGLQQEPLHELSVGLLGRAISLYHGDYLAQPDDYSWALPRQVHLKRLYIEALIALSRYYFLRKHYNRAQNYLLRLKAVDPFFEPAHRMLIKIHAYMGRTNALIEEHRNFRLNLMEETGLPPAPETIALFQELTNSASKN